MKLLYLIPLLISITAPDIRAQVSAYKESVTQEVCRSIINSYGTSKSKPILEIRPVNHPGKGSLLMYYPGDQPKIVMDEEVYDICVSLGKDSLNALAALLGHELAHHYGNHSWCSNFAYLLDEDQELKQKLSSISKEEKLRLEAEADYFGGFYGYVAGYNTFGVVPKMLDKLYQHYQLPDQLKGYPSKTERKKIAVQSLKKLEQWAAIFDAAEFLLSIKEFEMATNALEYLSEQFPSREIYNNTGISKILTALEFSDKEKLPFILPIEFDAQTRLMTGATREVAGDINSEYLSKILKSAIRNFEEAERRDPEYLPASINKASAYILLENYEMALGICKQVLNEKKLQDQSTLAKVYTVRAIAEFKRGEKEKAGKSFDKAASGFSQSYFNYNKQVYEKLNEDDWDQFLNYIYSFFEESNLEYGPEKLINPSLEIIGNAPAKDVRVSNDFLKTAVPGVNGFELHYQKSKGDHCQYLIANSSSTFRMSKALPEYGGSTSKNLRVGDPEKKIKLNYGEPTYTLLNNQGKYLVYKKSKIIFLTNGEGELVSWFLYHRE